MEKKPPALEAYKKHREKVASGKTKKVLQYNFEGVKFSVSMGKNLL